MGNRAALQAKETILNCDEYVKSLLGDLENAKRSIELETYIFNEDSFGKKIIDVLIKAASRGVKVRLLLDGIGTSSWYDGIRKILPRAIDYRGSSADSYLDLFGKPGEFVPRLSVYDRDGKPCLRRDGGIIKKIRTGGRGTYYCSVCQI